MANSEVIPTPTMESFEEIVADIESMCGELPPKAGWSADRYAEELILAVNKLTDAEFEQLEQQTIDWANHGSVAHKTDGVFALPPELIEKMGQDSKAKTKEKEKKAKPTKKEKKAKPSKANGKAEPSSSRGRGRPSALDPDAKIELLVEENPHRSGTKDHKKFKKVESLVDKLGEKATVGTLYDKGVELAYMRYAERRGLISVGG